MNAIMSLIRPVAGLFVDDGWLALAIMGIVALAAFFAYLLPSLSLVAGTILLFGCLGVLFANVLTASRRER